MLTREEVERIEATLQRNLSDFEIHGGMVRYWASIIDAKTLLREYRAVVDERDALAAEGRLLRGALETRVSHCETDGQLKSYCKEDYWCDQCTDADACAALTTAPLIAAEVARVRRLEAVLEAATDVLHDLCEIVDVTVVNYMSLSDAIDTYKKEHKC